MTLTAAQSNCIYDVMEPYIETVIEKLEPQKAIKFIKLALNDRIEDNAFDVQLNMDERIKSNTELIEALTSIRNVYNLKVNLALEKLGPPIDSSLIKVEINNIAELYLKDMEFDLSAKDEFIELANKKMSSNSTKLAIKG